MSIVGPVYLKIDKKSYAIINEEGNKDIDEIRNAERDIERQPNCCVRLDFNNINNRPTRLLAISTFASIFKRRSVKSITLENNNLKESEFYRLFGELRDSAVTSLNISGNAISGACLAFLFYAMIIHQLKMLNISFCGWETITPNYLDKINDSIYENNLTINIILEPALSLLPQTLDLKEAIQRNVLLNGFKSELKQYGLKRILQSTNDIEKLSKPII